jgi:hypothetical protein
MVRPVKVSWTWAKCGNSLAWIDEIGGCRHEVAIASSLRVTREIGFGLVPASQPEDDLDQRQFNSDFAYLECGRCARLRPIKRLLEVVGGVLR